MPFLFDGFLCSHAELNSSAQFLQSKIVYRYIMSNKVRNGEPKVVFSVRGGAEWRKSREKDIVATYDPTFVNFVNQYEDSVQYTANRSKKDVFQAPVAKISNSHVNPERKTTQRI